MAFTCSHIVTLVLTLLTLTAPRSPSHKILKHKDACILDPCQPSSLGFADGAAKTFVKDCGRGLFSTLKGRIPTNLQL